MVWMLFAILNVVYCCHKTTKNIKSNNNQENLQAGAHQKGSHMSVLTNLCPNEISIYPITVQCHELVPLDKFMFIVSFGKTFFAASLLWGDPVPFTFVVFSFHTFSGQTAHISNTSQQRLCWPISFLVLKLGHFGPLSVWADFYMVG